MLRRIVLENFMSHSRTVIEPADGLTILVGPNNCGKSAVVSALQSLCANLTGDYMVRHGARETTVTVDTDDGHTITWRRKGSTVSYVIDGEEVHRLRGGVPDRLHELLRLPKVRSAENGEDEFDIHFGTQKAPIFLINEPERRAAVFFAASSDAALLMQMQKRHAEKVKDTRRQRERLEKDFARIDQELAALKPIAALATGLQSVEHQYQMLDELCKHLAGIAQCLDSISREHTDGTRLSQELTVLSRLRDPYEPIDTRALQAITQSMSASQERLVVELAQTDVMSRLRDVPALTDVTSLTNLCGEIEAETEACSCLFSSHDVLAAMRPPPDFQEPAAFEQFFNDFDRYTELCSRATQECNALVDLRSPAPPLDPSPLALTISQMEAIHREIEAEGQSLRIVTEELAASEQCIRQWASTQRICNTCGAVLDPERLLSGANG